MGSSSGKHHKLQDLTLTRIEETDIFRIISYADIEQKVFGFSDFDHTEIVRLLIAQMRLEVSLTRLE